VVARLGRVPSQGEVLEFDGLRISVVRADPRRVYKVRIRRQSEGTVPTGEM
jgi:CBS domain containing-hemolysin-like protein